MASNPASVEPWAAAAAGGGAERLFGRFVCRLSGVASDRMDVLRASRTLQRLEALRAADEALASLRERVSELLFAAVGAEPDRVRRNAILRARRDLFNGRPLPPERLEAVRLSLPAPAAEAVRSLQTAILEHRRAESEAARAYADETAAIRGRFRELLRDAHFRKGLLVASRALYGSLERYEAAGAAPGGREEKTERGLLRYYTRAAMKATPFSTFCTVLPGRFVPPDGQGADEGAPLRLAGDLRSRRSYVRINKALYGILLDHLRLRPAVRRRLVVEPNPTLDVEGGRFVFLTALQRREVFQRVPTNDVLRLVVEVLRARPSSTLDDLVGALAGDPRVEATPEEAEAYLDRLVEIGFLRFRTGIREQDADWDLPLRALFDTVDDEHARRCSELLRALRERLDAYSGAPVDQRAALVEEVHATLDAAFAEMGVTERIRGEMPFYEDATADAEALVPLTPGVLRAADTLAEWIRLTVRLAWPRPEQATMRHFFDTHYGEGAAAVPLLRFYEDFYREHFKEHVEKERKLRAGRGGEELAGYQVGNPFGLDFVDAMNAARARFQDLVLARWREAPDAEEVSIPLGAVEEALRGVEPLPGACRSVGVFAGLAPPGAGDDPAFLLHGGSYTAGYGKFFSRFLYMLPEELREAVRAENEELTGGLLAEVCGDAHFNANLHPPLLPREISYPTGESGAAEEQIRSSEIEVGPDPDDAHALALRHAPTGLRVVPVDLGFLNPRMRPPLYQLLSRFTPPVVFGPSLPETLARPPRRPAREGQDAAGPGADAPGEPAPGETPPPARRVEHRPRVTVEGRVVLARRRWSVPRELFPQREPEESAAAFFARADRWRRESGIPERCYLRILVLPDPSRRRPGAGAPPEEAPDAQEAAMNLGGEAPADPAAAEGEARADGPAAGAAPERRGRPATPGSRDLHKPQYVDFANPLLVALLGKMGANLRSYRVVVEESLPDRGGLARHGGESYATEVIVQLGFPEGAAEPAGAAAEGGSDASFA